MMSQFIRAGLFLAALALMFLPGDAFATVVPGLSFEQLTDQSEMVVAGSVVRSWSDWDSSHQFIWTHHEITVSGWFKGAAGTTVVVSEPGGVVGDRGMSVAGTVSYAPGESVVVFLQRMPNGYLRTTGWGQGKYVVDKAGLVHGTGASGGLEIVKPDGPGQQAALTPLRTLEGITAEQFRARVEARVRSAKQ
jgi:hypothetical protein